MMEYRQRANYVSFPWECCKFLVHFLAQKMSRAFLSKNSTSEEGLRSSGCFLEQGQEPDEQISTVAREKCLRQKSFICERQIKAVIQHTTTSTSSGQRHFSHCWRLLKEPVKSRTKWQPTRAHVSKRNVLRWHSEWLSDAHLGIQSF